MKKMSQIATILNTRRNFEIIVKTVTDCLTMYDIAFTLSTFERGISFTFELRLAKGSVVPALCERSQRNMSPGVEGADAGQSEASPISE